MCNPSFGYLSAQSVVSAPTQAIGRQTSSRTRRVCPPQSVFTVFVFKNTRLCKALTPNPLEKWPSYASKVGHLRVANGAFTVRKWPSYGAQVYGVISRGGKTVTKTAETPD